MADKRPSLTQRPTAADLVPDDTPLAGTTVTVTSPTPPPPREPTRRLTLDIPERLHRVMKIRSATTGVTMLDEVRALLEAHYRDQ